MPRLPLRILGLLLLCAGAAHAANGNLRIPRVTRAPQIEDFEEMAPRGAAAQMAKVSGFIQKNPSDGQPATQKTEVYLGYDDNNLYLIWLCFDSNPGGIRAHTTRRENMFDDDYVEVTLDTFHDQRHGFLFDANALGVQADGLWTDGGNPDWSFDTLWHSRGHINARGFVVWMAIPFRSLRFRPAHTDWGITLMRYCARNDESDYWPRVSSTVSGRLNQEASVSGVEGVSSGRNMQFIPYLAGRSFRSLDNRDPAQPRFSSHRLDGKAGLDSKFVFRDSLVLDTTINPDFAQVESDEPQNTINQRFEVFFPEKRPFFMENANFFEAPLIAVPLQSHFVFSRRIADPSFGVRLSGKQGPWNLGLLVADDRSPGKRVPIHDPLHDKRAYFAVGRVSHDFGEQSSLGVLFTHREFQNDFNRVGGVDGAFRLGKNWTSSFRAMVSSTSTPADGYLFGQHYEGVLHGTGRRFTYDLQLLDITPNFRTETGFVPRVDQRAINQYAHFYWRPEGKHLIFHGLEGNTTQMWDHRGNLVQHLGSFDYVWGFRRNIVVAPIVSYQTDTLRPNDFSGLPGNRKYAQDAVGLVFRGTPSRLLSWNTRVFRQGTIVLVPAGGQLPYVGDETFLNQTLSIKPTGRLQVDNTYIFDRVLNGAAKHSVFNNHIVRSKWNYQFTRELSLRFIAQYNGLLANPQFSSLQTTKNVNFDFLITYLRHPGTAVYVGYNTNLENVDPGLCVRLAGATECDPSGSGLIRTRSRLINDGRLIFVKVSYLFRR